MTRYRKKPVVIEARRFTGTNRNEIEIFMSAAGGLHLVEALRADGSRGPAIIIPTLEGDHRADVGDWIIRGVKGEFYPCKPDIFEMTYEPENGRYPSKDSRIYSALEEGKRVLQRLFKWGVVSRREVEPTYLELEAAQDVLFTRHADK